MTDLVKRLGAPSAYYTAETDGDADLGRYIQWLKSRCKEAASALESFSAENAALKEWKLNQEIHWPSEIERRNRDLAKAESRAATLLQQRNEAFKRAAAVADGFAKDNAANAREMIAGETIAAGIRNLSKES